MNQNVLNSTNVAIQRINMHLQAGRCVPFVGAGASIAAGGPTLQEYLEQMMVGLNLDVVRAQALFEIQDYSVAASEVARLRTSMKLPHPEVQLRGPSPIHHALATWDAKLYVTTNYDDGLEQAVRQHGHQCRVLKNDQIAESDLLGISERHKIIKLATSAAHLDLTGLIGEEQLADLVYASPVVDLMATIIRTHLLVFVGCSLVDILTRSILQQCRRSNIGYVRPIAILSPDTKEETRLRLSHEDVDVCIFEDGDKTRRLVELLARVRPIRRGDRHILIYEPGARPKLEQTLAAAEQTDLDEIASVTIITTQKVLIDLAKAWGADQSPSVRIEAVLVGNINNVEEVLGIATQHKLPWNCLITPFEYATLAASQFAEAYNSRGYSPRLRFHDSDTSRLSRDKRRFREFLTKEFSQHPLIKPTPFAKLRIEPQDSAEVLLQKIRNSPLQNKPEIVIKPVDAAGSTGVRPVSLELDRECYALEVLRDFLVVIRDLPAEAKTHNCDTSEVLIEERIVGDEFSIECRRVRADDAVETIAIHWKPGIDDDRLRFFERIYVTVPPGDPVHKKLSKANAELLKQMGGREGVFHAEYRLNDNGIYPLEIGFRPGGGTVSQQVKASHGVDMCEAMLRCGLQQPATPSNFRQVVAAAEVFADKPGVLPPLRIKMADGKRYCVANGKTGEARAALQARLSKTSRSEARNVLVQSLSLSPSEYAKSVIEAFDSSGPELRAKVDDFMLWMHPGDEVIEEEAAYVAGLRVVAGQDLHGMEAVAEALAAMEVCYQAIDCEPEPILRFF